MVSFNMLGVCNPLGKADCGGAKDSMNPNTIKKTRNFGFLFLFILLLVAVIPQYGVATPWNVSTAEYTGLNFSVASQETESYGLSFKPDGTAMYIIGYSSDKVHQYSLSTAWNVSTATLTNSSSSLVSIAGTEVGLFFKPDGTKVYVVGEGDDAIYQYDLSTAWEVATMTYSGKSKAVGSYEGNPRDVHFSSDGTKMYVIGIINNKVHQYSLSTAWDVSTATYSKSLSVLSSMGLFFKPDGSILYTIGNIHSYSLSTVWDISTADYLTTKSISGFDLFFNQDGTLMYTLSGDVVYQYSLPVDFVEITSGDSYHPSSTNATYVAAENMTVDKVDNTTTYVSFETANGFSNFSRNPTSPTNYSFHDVTIRFFSQDENITGVSFNISAAGVSAEYTNADLNSTVVLLEDTYNISYVWQGRAGTDEFTVNSSSDQTFEIEVDGSPFAPTNLIYWGAFKDWTLKAEASGSTDPNNDSIEYHYQFTDQEGNILQAYSTNAAVSTDGFSIIQILAKAKDSYGGFSSPVSVNVTIQETPNPQNKTYSFDSGYSDSFLPYSGSLDLRNTTRINYANVSVSLLDQDSVGANATSLSFKINNNTVFQGMNVLNKNGEVYSGVIKEFLTVDSQNTFNLSADSFTGTDIKIVINFTIFSDYASFIETLQILPEGVPEFNMSNIENVKIIIYCRNGTTYDYPVDTSTMNLSAIPVACPYEYVSAIMDWSTQSYQRNQVFNDTFTNITFHMIDLFQTPYIVDNIYFTSDMAYDWVVLYSSRYGNLDWKQVDLSNKVSFQMIQNNPYQIHVYDGTQFVRSIGNIASSYSETFYVSLEPYMATVPYQEGVNISYEVENSSIKVVYIDPEDITDWVRVEISNATDSSILYDSTVPNSSVIFTYNVNTINQTFRVKTTYKRDGNVFETVRYFRNGEVLTVPVDIPQWFLVGGIAFLLVAIALVFPAGVSAIGAVVVSVSVALVDYLGFISLPKGLPILLLIVSATAFIASSRRGGAV